MEKILVIDDDVGLCELVSEYLGPEGYEVESVHNGERGIDRALASDHALVVLDVMLPGMTGFAQLRMTRENDLHHFAQLIFQEQTAPRKTAPAAQAVEDFKPASSNQQGTLWLSLDC